MLVFRNMKIKQAFRSAIHWNGFEIRNGKLDTSLRWIRRSAIIGGRDSHHFFLHDSLPNSSAAMETNFMLATHILMLIS